MAVCNPQRCSCTQASSPVGTRPCQVGPAAMGSCSAESGEAHSPHTALWPGGQALSYLTLHLSLPQYKETCSDCKWSSGSVFLACLCWSCPQELLLPLPQRKSMPTAQVPILHGWEGTRVLSFTGNTAERGCSGHIPWPHTFLMSFAPLFMSAWFSCLMSTETVT